MGCEWSAVYDGESILLQKELYERGSEVYVDVKQLTRVKFNRMLRLMVTCSHGMDILMYYIISKGSIVDIGFFRPNQRIRYTFQILVSKELTPVSMIYLIASANGKFATNYISFTVREFVNPIEIKIEENISDDGVDLGDEIELSIRGRPGSFVALAAYVHRFMQHSKHHDIFYTDVWYLFNKLHPVHIDVIEILGANASILNVKNYLKGKFRH
ncbi:uncharacterized protein LOC126576631 [Anopheles aquasalis]|uniref:uncharacterized protein LOC126576631 n=1 Tax=Anopheles aquasalis TaxID=42839 RepID=UPI00215AD8F8|nr:uncharacterized protein LOC126576631 [Anopheles aquasalis]